MFFSLWNLRKWFLSGERQPCRALGRVQQCHVLLRWLQQSFQVLIKRRMSSVQEQVKRKVTRIIFSHSTSLHAERALKSRASTRAERAYSVRLCLDSQRSLVSNLYGHSNSPLAPWQNPGTHEITPSNASCLNYRLSPLVSIWGFSCTCFLCVFLNYFW